MSSTLTPSGWVVEQDVVDERKDLPRLTGAQIDALNARIAAGSKEFPTATAIVRIDDETLMVKRGVGVDARFAPAPSTTADLSFIQAGAGAVVRTAQEKQRDELNVLDFGADPTGAADSTIAIQAACAALSVIGSGTLRARGVFKVAVAQGQSLGAFTNKSQITLDFSGATIDNSSVSYTADALTPIFLFDGGSGFRVDIGEYIGYTLPAPQTYLGYRGATLVRAINGAKKLTVDVRKASNLRYGIQTGEYGDATKGGCAFIDLKIRGSMIGYPIAAYLADHINIDVDVDGVHRAAYIAGCDSVVGIVQWRDQFIADVALLITDALQSGTDAAAQADPVGSPTTSRGTSNLRMSSIDKGSTVFSTSSRCAGISLSRVDPVIFKNIEVFVSTKGTDTVSTTVGGWMIASAAKAVQTRYPFNWEPTIVLDNVSVSGTVDHSSCTLPGNTGSEFYVFTYDTSTAHAATVRNFSANNFQFLPSSGQTRVNYFHVPGLANASSFNGYDTPGVGMSLFTNATVPTVFGRGRIADLDVSGVTGGAAVAIGPGAVVGSQTSNVLITNTVLNGGAISGAGFAIRQRLIKMPALVGASVSVANAFQAGEMIFGVQGLIKTTIPGPTTGINVGVAGTVSRYANQNILAAGSKFTVTAAATDADRAPHYYASSTALLVTAKTADFAGGELWVVITYGRFPDMS
ncbi:hypothetical protein J2W30_003622 [Variovorax boronicumulans]|uniref:hypothetical protein n=1 Tax=Variovorax boronicumulans TaxID=436515 RepID=UPI0027839A8D|nr:hypothetical protein [Variovorax boronicumulans]MDQ0035854.1 hypothetical protein [Variovorax boronicumulans]